MVLLLLQPAGASANCDGGVTGTERNCSPTVPGAKAKLVEGMAVAPASAPAAVKKVVEAANRIRTKPYLWGGGHGR